MSATIHAPARATPQEILAALADGNARFVSGAFVYPHQDAARRAEVVAGQSPFAAVLACSDSRLPPEVIFDLGIGDIFVVRTAGHVLDEIAVGSLEYAVEHLHVPLALVLGHQGCGAVRAAVKGEALPGHLAELTAGIQPAVEAARQESGDLVVNTVDAHIRLTVARLMAAEPVLSGAVQAGGLAVIGARYDLDSGKVTFFAEADGE
jgi:carbonic anhydrase